MAVKLKCAILKTCFFLNKKLNYWKLPWHQKVDSKPENFFYMVHFFAWDKNVTKPNGFMEWKWRHCIEVEWRKVKKQNKKWNEQKTSYISKISKDIFHPVLFKNEGTSTLRTSLKKNILEEDAAYIFAR